MTLLMDYLWLRINTSRVFDLKIGQIAVKFGFSVADVPRRMCFTSLMPHTIQSSYNFQIFFSVFLICSPMHGLHSGLVVSTHSGYPLVQIPAGTFPVKFACSPCPRVGFFPQSKNIILRFNNASKSSIIVCVCLCGPAMDFWSVQPHLPPSGAGIGSSNPAIVN